MSDQRLRAAEREAQKAADAPAAAVALLRERLRAGTLAPRYLAVAAAVGDLNAREVMGDEIRTTREGYMCPCGSMDADHGFNSSDGYFDGHAPVHACEYYYRKQFEVNGEIPAGVVVGDTPCDCTIVERVERHRRFWPDNRDLSCWLDDMLVRIAELEPHLKAVEVPLRMSLAAMNAVVKCGLPLRVEPDVLTLREWAQKLERHARAWLAAGAVPPDASTGPSQLLHVWNEAAHAVAPIDGPLLPQRSLQWYPCACAPDRENMLHWAVNASRHPVWQPESDPAFRVKRGRLAGEVAVRAAIRDELAPWLLREGA